MLEAVCLAVHDVGHDDVPLREQQVHDRWNPVRIDVRLETHPGNLSIPPLCGQGLQVVAEVATGGNADIAIGNPSKRQVPADGVREALPLLSMTLREVRDQLGVERSGALEPVARDLSVRGQAFSARAAGGERVVLARESEPARERLRGRGGDVADDASLELQLLRPIGAHARDARDEEAGEDGARRGDAGADHERVAEKREP